MRAIRTSYVVTVLAALAACSGGESGTKCQTNDNCAKGQLCAAGRCVRGGLSKRITTDQHPKPDGLAIAPDGKTVAVSSGERIGLWDLDSGQQANRIVLGRIQDKTYSASYVCYIPQRDTLAAWVTEVDDSISPPSTTQLIYLWSANGATKTAELPVGFDDHGSLICSAEYLAVISMTYDEAPHDTEVVLWHADSLTEAARTTIEDRYCESLCLSSDGAMLAAGCDRAVIAWDIGSQSDLTERWRWVRLLDHSSAAVSFSPDGRRVAAAESHLVTLLDSADGADVFAAEKPASNDDAHRAAFSPDSSVFAVICSEQGDKNTAICIYSTATGNAVTTLSGHRDSVDAIGYLPSEKTLVAATSEPSLVIWDLSGL